MRLKNDVTVTYLANIGFGTKITIPAGSVVHMVGNQYVVSSVKQLVELTGNSHDPKYRYCWLPEGVEVEA